MSTALSFPVVHKASFNITTINIVDGDNCILRAPNTVKGDNTIAKFLRFDGSLLNSKRASKLMVVPPEVLETIKRHDGYVSNRVWSKACDTPLNIVDRTDLLSCLEIIKHGAVQEVFLRACTLPPKDVSAKQSLKAHENDKQRLWRLNESTLNAIKSNVLASKPFYQDANNDPELTKRIAKTFDKIKSSTVEHADDAKGNTKTQLVDTDYDRIFEIEDATTTASFTSLAASKTKATERAVKDYEMFEAPFVNLRKRHFDIESGADGPGVKIFKISNASDCKLVEINGEKRLILVPTPEDETDADVVMAMPDGDDDA